MFLKNFYLYFLNIKKSYRSLSVTPDQLFALCIYKDISVTKYKLKKLFQSLSFPIGGDTIGLFLVGRHLIC